MAEIPQHLHGDSKNMTARKKATLSGIQLIHHGTELPLRLTHNTTYTGLLVFFDTKSKGFESPDVRIAVRGKSTVDSFFPSEEGTVIWCRLNSGEERYYETRTGKRLTEKQLQKLSANGKVHFIQ